MDHRDKILSFVRVRGPILPAQIAKELNQNQMVASAMLSEAVGSGELKLSNAKVGSSPVYYMPGQEDRLPDLLYKYLNDKEKKAFELLKNKSALQDRALDPVTRVALRQIKDFAVPVDVILSGKKEVFWRYYLKSEEEVTPIIKNILGIQEESIEQKNEIDQLQRQREDIQRQKKELQGLKDAQKNEEKLFSDTALGTNNFPNEIIHDKDKLNHKEMQKDNAKDALKDDDLHSKANKFKDAVKKIISPALSESKHNNPVDKQVSEFVDTGFPKDEFFDYVHNYFVKNNIRIISHKLLRKESEIEFTVMVPSSVGELHYYCRAKNKKKCNEGDLSTAFFSANSKKLPILFLTTGEVTKKAIDLTKTEFRSMTMKNI